MGYFSQFSPILKKSSLKPLARNLIVQLDCNMNEFLFVGV